MRHNQKLMLPSTTPEHAVHGLLVMLNSQTWIFLPGNSAGLQKKKGPISGLFLLYFRSSTAHLAEAVFVTFFTDMFDERFLAFFVFKVDVPRGMHAAVHASDGGGA